MKLISVNIGKARSILTGKKTDVTGIFKLPVQDPVKIVTSGLAGDTICDAENHGGPDQAVYVYGEADYAWWSQEMGREIQPGTFGENLTISELESASAMIGDRLQIGSVILEVTSPRIPCATLAARMKDPTFVKRYRYAERPGLYCRVIQEGYLRSGDAVTYIPHPGETVSLIELFRVYYLPKVDEATLRRHLAAPIAVRDRVAKENQLAKLLSELST